LASRDLVAPNVAPPSVRRSHLVSVTRSRSSSGRPLGRATDAPATLRPPLSHCRNVVVRRRCFVLVALAVSAFFTGCGSPSKVAKPPATTANATNLGGATASTSLGAQGGRKVPTAGPLGKFVGLKPLGSVTTVVDVARALQAAGAGCVDVRSGVSDLDHPLSVLGGDQGSCSIDAPNGKVRYSIIVLSDRAAITRATPLLLRALCHIAATGGPTRPSLSVGVNWVMVPDPSPDIAVATILGGTVMLVDC
jgi:hypothetical protein